MEEFKHDDFEVVRVVPLFGGYEELRHKDKDTAEHTLFFRKSITPGKPEEFDALMGLEQKVMSDGCSGTVHPIYDHDSRKWALFSVPRVYYAATGLPA